MDKQLILDYYVPLSLPIPFKEWEVHPIMVKDSYKWQKCFDILNMDKNSSNDVEIIKMTYLEFLVAMGQTESIVIEKLFTILQLCLGLDNQLIDIQRDPVTEGIVILIVPYVTLKNGDKVLPDYSEAQKITSQDFDELKQIILYQNVLDYDDSYVDPDVKEAADEYYALLNKNTPTVSMERRMAVITTSTGLTADKLLSMTFRAFNLLFDTVVDKVDYSIMHLAEFMPDVEFKKPIEHWAYKPIHNRYEEAFVDFEGFKSKLGSANG